MTDETVDREYWVQRRTCPVCREQVSTIVEARSHCDTHVAIVTADHQIVKPGDRVFNYYDLKWGVIQDDVDDQGWFTVLHEDGSRSTLNGERIAYDQPSWLRNPT